MFPCSFYHRKQEATLKDKVQEFETKFESFKHEKNREVMEVKNASKKNEYELQQQMAALRSERNELLSQFEELKSRYKEDSMDWEDNLEHEQDLRARAEREFEKELARTREEARQYFNHAKTEATKQMVEREKKLRQQEHDLIQARWNLEAEEIKVCQLERQFETHRSSVREMTRASLDLVENRVKGTLRRLNPLRLNPFKRSKSTEQVEDTEPVEEMEELMVAEVIKR